MVADISLCIDTKAVNNVTKNKKEAYPLPIMQECLDTPSEEVYISNLIVISGFYQVKMHPDDHHKTAFLTNENISEFSKMAMGLCNAPTTFK